MDGYPRQARSGRGPTGGGLPSRLFALLLGLGALATGAFGPADGVAGEPYAWPLSEPICVTSGFCDYRPGHFHAGIDLSTGGREGLAVCAADSGWVVRARASCEGYGRAVYIQMDDGRTAVYGHLSRFSPEITRRVQREQQRRGSYEVDLALAPGQIRVRRGEVVGYTGQTGAGPPHLHYELRDQRQHPLNPLTHGVLLADAVAPALASLIVRPLDCGSLANGRRSDLEVGLRWEGSEHGYAAEETVFCSGRVGLLVEGSDRADGCPRALSLAGVSLELDGTLLFKSRFEEFGYEETGRIDTYYDRGRQRSERREFHRLYREKGNAFSFCAPFQEWDGVIRYPRGGAGAGVHRVEIGAEDAAGNRSRARVALVLNEAPVLSSVEAHVAEGGIEVLAEVEDPEGDSLFVRVRAEGSRAGTSVERYAECIEHSAEPAERRAGDIESLARRGERRRYRAFLPWPKEGGSASVICTAIDRWGAESIPRRVGVAEPGMRGDGEGRQLDLRAAVGPTLDCLEIDVRTPVPLLGEPRVWVPGTGGAEATVEPVSALHDRALVPLSREFNGPMEIRAAARSLEGDVLEGRAEIVLWNVSPETGGRLSCESADGHQRLSVTVEPGRTFRDLWLSVGEGGPWSGAGELVPAGPVFRVDPMDAVFDGNVSVDLRWDAERFPAERLGLCSSQEDSKWEWAGGEWDAASGSLRTSVRYLTRFCLAADLTAPRLRIVKPANGSHLTSGAVSLRAQASDKGSGLACGSVGMALDGAELIAEFDPELELVSALYVPVLARGKHVLVVRAVDRAGNRSEERSAFWVD